MATKGFSNSNSKWCSKWPKHENAKKNKGSDSKTKGLDIAKKKVTSNSSSSTITSRHRDVKCFKCHGLGHYASDYPNKRMMVIRGGEVMSKFDDGNESSGSDDMPPLEDCFDDDENVHMLCMVNLLLLHVLNM